jgi:hypothetical protein
MPKDSNKTFPKNLNESSSSTTTSIKNQTIPLLNELKISNNNSASSDNLKK